jgi:hypothetical protein
VSGDIGDDLKRLASGINHVIASLNGGKELEFMLILVRPHGDEVTLNTITGITDPYEIRTIGQHLIDMAAARGASLDSDNDVQGHA